MRDVILTNVGKNLLQRAGAGETKIKFASMATSSTVYIESQIPNMVEIADIKQTSLVSSIEKRDDMIVISAPIQNADLLEGYYIHTLGIYAEDDNQNLILYAVSLADDNPEYMPPGTQQDIGIIFKVNSRIQDSEFVDFTIDPAASATMEQVEQVRSEVEGVQQELTVHKEGNPSSDEGVHGLRIRNKNIQYYDEEQSQWIETLAGIPARFIITVPENSTVTISKDDTSYEYTDETEIVQDIYEYGAWKIEATNGEDTTIQEIEVDVVQIYEIELKYGPDTVIVMLEGAVEDTIIVTETTVLSFDAITEDNIITTCTFDEGESQGEAEVPTRLVRYWSTVTILESGHYYRDVAVTAQPEETIIDLEGAVEDTVVVTGTSVSSFEQITEENTIATSVFTANSTIGQVTLMSDEEYRFWSTVADLGTEGHYYTNATVRKTIKVMPDQTLREGSIP